MAVSDWSTTAGDNTSLGSILLAENVMLVADVNDAFRELMAQVKAALGVTIQEYSAALNAIAGLATTDGNVIVGDGSTWVAESGATARASLGLTIGTDVQAFDAGLASIAGLTTAADRMIYTTASDTYAVATLTAFARSLLDDTDAATARTTLGVDAAGTDNSTDVTLAGSLDYLTIVGQTITRNAIDLTTDVTGDLPIAEGGTGASDAATARTNLGLGSLATLNTVNNGNWSGTDLAVGNGGTGASNASGARTNLGLVIGTDVQAQGATLTSLEGLSLAAGDILYATAAATLARLPKGTDDQVLALASGVPSWADAASDVFGSQLLHVRDEKSSGTDGGTFTSGAWRTRDLNTTKTNEISGASLATNQITLPAGDYYIWARAPAREVNQHQAKLRNVTDSTDIILGSNNLAIAASQTQGGDSHVIGRFTLAAEKDLELQHQCNATNTTDGFGRAGSFGTEVYSEVMIWKVG